MQNGEEVGSQNALRTRTASSMNLNGQWFGETSEDDATFPRRVARLRCLTRAARFAAEPRRAESDVKVGKPQRN